MNEIKITIPLITHIPKTQNKNKKDKYIKINNQSIYNGLLNRFTRAIVVENLHAYFANNIEEEFKGLSIDSNNIKLLYEFYTVYNHGDVRLLKTGISWNPPKKGYEPRWDLDNLADLWCKIGSDTLVLEKVIKEDTVQFIKEKTCRFIEIKELYDAKIDITITY
jgi:hypothetical protein